MKPENIDKVKNIIAVIENNKRKTAKIKNIIEEPTGYERIHFSGIDGNISIKVLPETVKALAKIVLNTIDEQVETLNKELETL